METRETPQPLRGGLVSGAARFGPLLRTYRLAAGLTLQELAQVSGLSRRAISALELGYRRAPRTRTLERLAIALRLDPEMRAAFIAAGRGALILLPRSQPSIVPTDAALPAALPDTPEEPPHSLPLPPTPLLGREHEVAELTALLRKRSARLITLTGPGGVGKTRLALEVAWALQHAGDVFPDGAWLVRLAPLSDPALVLPTIAQALGLRETGGASLADQLRGFLRDRSLLLLLDNFEQVAAAAPQIAELLEASPGLALLVTSRSTLRVRAERAYMVSLLDVPPGAQGRIPAEQLERYAATALFLQRARDVRPDFPVTDASAPLIAASCARLNGLPLAIELAATWARLLSPSALLAQLERRLDLLTAGPVDLPARQQTMRAAIAWSYDLLDAESQRLFGRLAVFVDGWTLDEASAVCLSPPGAAPLRQDTLTGLSVLLDQSLISQRVSEDGAEETPRLEMLHVVREFALEQLEASGEAEAVRRAHARYILAFAEGAEPGLRGSDDIAWMKVVERELGNVRAALEWARVAGEAEVGLRLATALWRFWLEAGYLSEGRQWVETLLALATPEAAETTAETTQAARPQASSIPTWLLARALTTTGILAAGLRDVGPAIAALEEGLRLARETGEWVARVTALLFLGGIAHLLGDLQRTKACYEEALAVGREREHALTVLTALGSLAGLACAQQQWANAAALLSEALATARAAQQQQYAAAFLIQLGEVALWQGEAPRAAPLLGEALAVARETNWATGWRRWDAIEALDLLAVACAQRGWDERGARLLGASAQLRETLWQPYVSAEQPRREALVAPIRAALSAEPWEAAFAAGQRLTLEETFAEALVDASALAGGEGGSRADASASAADRSAAMRVERLTRRELEVLRLLAEGWTDAQIADQLVLSPRTVNHHVASLYSKLGVTSRAAATRFALDRSLL